MLGYIGDERRIVKLYEVTTRELPMMEVVKLHKFGPKFDPCGYGPIARMNSEIITVPVHNVRKLNKDHFIAIHPDLREILEAPFQSKMSHLQYCYTRSIIQFNKLPWWKRGLLAIRKAIPMEIPDADR